MLQRQEMAVKSWTLSPAVYILLFKGKYLSEETCLYVCLLSKTALVELQN